jgi:hypothetical protein
MRKKVLGVLACAGMVLGGLAVSAPAASATEPPCGITVVGGPHADRIVGTNCDDQLYGLGGNDTIRGRLGTDNVYGGRGNDLLTDSSTLSGGTIHGGRGWDICIVPEQSNVEIFGCEVIEEV